MSAPTRRQLLLASAGILGTAALAACGGKEQGNGDSPSGSLDKIKVGYIEDGNGCMLVAIAKKQGLWAKHGLEAETIAFTNGPLQIQALGTGDLDFGYIGFGALWLPMSGQAKVVSINSRGLADRIIGQPGVGTIEDLKGKPVGVPEGTSGDILLGLALKRAGMTAQDVQRLAMDPPTTISAFASKQVEGAAIWYPHVATITKQVPDLVEIVKSADFDDLAFLAAQVTAPNITERAEVLKKFQAVCKEAFTWAAANREETTTLLAEFLGLPEENISSEQEFVQVYSSDEVVKGSGDGSFEAFLKGLNEVFVEQGKIDKVSPVSDYWLATEYEKA